MSISFQLIELPEDEQIASRQVSLPTSGGTIGRSFECSIQLPDFGRTLSRVHAEVLPSPNGGFQIVDRSTNGVFVNNIRLGKGESHRLSDGDNIRMGAYTLLFSDMESLFAREPDTTETQSLVEEAPVFDRQAVFNSGAESVLGGEAMFANEQAEPPAPKGPEFSADNVSGEDLYGYDPFEDEDKWEMSERGDDEDAFVDDDVVMFSEHDELSSTNKAIAIANSHQVAALESSIDRLNHIIEQQQKTILASVDRDRLVGSIESALDRFLEEFDPEQLEDEFNDYITGWGRKDKKYWALYKKQFKRKKERRDFYRKFSALLFEELREQR